MGERLCCPVDAYLLLERGGKLLMLRRAPDAAYAAGLLCPPSGHVENGEDALSAAVPETAEETGVTLPQIEDDRGLSRVPCREAAVTTPAGQQEADGPNIARVYD